MFLHTGVPTPPGSGYVLPETGIPATDMAAAVQASLGKADNALPTAGIDLGTTDNALVRTNGTGGKSAQATGIIVGDSNEVSGARAKLTSTTTSGDVTLDWSVPHLSITLDAVRAIEAPTTPGAVGAEILLMLDCAGYTPTWGTGFAHADGTPPTLDTTSGAVNLFSVVWSPILSKALLVYAGVWS